VRQGDGQAISMNKELVAPCGMNCALCANYLCHNGLCFSCDFGKLRGQKNKYRWEGA